MGKLISFPQNKHFHDEVTSEKFASFDEALSEFFNSVDAGDLFRAAVPLSWMLLVGVPTANRYVQFYAENCKEGKFNEKFKNLPELLESGETTDFTELMSRCFGLNGIEAINCYIQIKKNKTSVP